MTKAPESAEVTKNTITMQIPIYTMADPNGKFCKKANSATDTSLEIRVPSCVSVPEKII